MLQGAMNGARRGPARSVVSAVWRRVAIDPIVAVRSPSTRSAQQFDRLDGVCEQQISPFL